MARHAAVGIHDDLASGEAAVTERSANHELPGGIHVEAGTGVQPFGGDHRADDLVDHRRAQVCMGDGRAVLGRDHDGVDCHRLAVLVADRDLALGIGSEPRQDAFLAQLGLAAHQAVRVGDRRRHQHVGLVAGIAEHETLVAGTLFLVLALVLVHTLGDIG